MAEVVAGVRRPGGLTEEPKGGKGRAVLCLERLEAREVPATFYVSTTGSDAAAGGAADPWRTLQYAANQVGPGDTVVVRPGDYAGFHLTADGTAAARITFTAEPGARVTVRNPTTNDGINLEGADYVTVQGFTVVGIGRAGIRSVINRGAVIRNNVCDQNGYWGILTGYSEGVLIEGNTCSRSQVEHGIYVADSADDPVIRGNTAWGNRANGIHVNAGSFQIGDGAISRALIEGNVIYDNGLGGGSGINCDGVQDSVIRNNLIYNARASGISLYRVDAGQPSTGNRVVNNTVLVAADGRWALNLADGATNNTIRNNILFSAHPFRGAFTASADSLPGLVSDFNLTEDRFSADGGDTPITLAQWRTATGRDANSFTTAAPAGLFVDPAGGNYRLAPNSPAVDAGTAAGAPAADLEGTPRPSGAGVDIGSDELAVPTVRLDVTAPAGSTVGTAFVVTVTARTAGGASDPWYRGTVQFSSTDPQAVLPALYTFTAADAGAKTFTVTLGTAGTRSVVATDAATGSVTGTATVAVTPAPGTPPGTPPANPTPPADPAPGTPPAAPVPAPAPAEVVRPIMVNAPAGTQVVRVLNPDGSTRAALTPHAGFLGGIVAAAGDITGDGVPDAVTAATLGGHVKAFDGATGAEIKSFFAFPGYAGPIYLATGDLTGDGVADLIVAANLNGHVKVFDGLTDGLTTSFFAYAGYTGPVAVGAADLDGDGRAELITAADGGAGVHVKALAPDTLALRDSFLATAGGGGGFSVSGGDIDGDGVAEFLVSQGSNVRVLDGRTKAVRGAFPAFDAGTPGVTVQAAQADGDPWAEVVAVADARDRAHVKVFDGPAGGLQASYYAGAR